MDCAELERRLDQRALEDPEVREAAELHAASCARCADALAEAARIDTLLSAPAPAAPSGFADRVMARIGAERRFDHAVAGIPTAPAMPWWVRAAADPAVVLAMVLAAVVVGAAGSPATYLVREWVLAALESAPRWLVGAPSSVARTGLEVGLLPVVVLASLGLYRWSRDRCVRFAARRVGPDAIS